MFGKQYAVYDMSGDIQYLDLWEDYYETIQGIIFVIEAKDKKRINQAKDLLKQTLLHKHIKMKNKPIFFAVNKFDEADTCSA